MRNVFSNQLKATAFPLAIALALTVAVGATQASHAAGTTGAKTVGMWNPKNWFNATSTSADDAANARKKAEQAQQAADQAMQEAQKALDRAAEARRHADDVAGMPQNQPKKLVVSPPPQAETQTHDESVQSVSQTQQDGTQANSEQGADQDTDKTYQAPAKPTETTLNFSTVTPKKEPWNPLSWFHKDEDAATGLDGSIPGEKQKQQASQQQTSTPQQDSAAAFSTDTSKTDEPAKATPKGAWHLHDLFAKPTQNEQTQTAPENKTQSEGSQLSEEKVQSADQEQSAPQATEQTEPSKATDTSDAQKETTASEETSNKQNQTANDAETQSGETENKNSAKQATTQGKGGWNLMSILSKGPHADQPAQDAKDTQEAKDTKEADKAPQANSEESDQSVKTKAALIETEKGNIAIELYPDQAPLTVANFVKLIDSGFYNRFNMRFHRVVPGFVVQTGDPTGTGAGGSKERVPLEAKNKLSHNTKGVVAMARGADPNSATSQFYITLAPQTALDGKYAIFGKVISGSDVLAKIEKGDMMYGIRLVDLSSVVRDQPTEKKKFFSSLF